MTTIVAIAAALTITAGSAAVERTVIGNADALAITESTAEVSAGVSVPGNSDALAITAGSATVSTGATIFGSADSVALSAGSAVVNGAHVVTGTGPVELAITGSAAIVDSVSSATTPFVAAATKTGHAPVWLMELDHDGSTYYYSDRAISDGTNSYAARVTEWGDISYINDRLSGGGIVSNVALTLSEIDSTGWAPVSPKIQPGNEVRLYCWFSGEGLTKSDRLLKFSGRIIDPIEMSEAQITFNMDSHERYYNALVGDILDTSEFPGADPDDIGEMKPIVYGQVYGHRCLAVDAGSVDNIVRDITDVDVTFEFSDSSGFPASGTIQIDAEQMSYTLVVDNVASDVTRGVNSTTQVSHDAGAKAVEVQTIYKYLIADHDVKSTAVTAMYAGSTTTIYSPLHDLSTGGIVSVFGSSSSFDGSYSVTIIDLDTYSIAATLGSSNETISVISHSDCVVYVDDVRQAGVDYRIFNEANQAFIEFGARPILIKSVDIEVETTDDIGVESTLTIVETIDNETTTTANETVSQDSYSSFPASVSVDNGQILAGFNNPSGSITSQSINFDWTINFYSISGGGFLIITFGGVTVFRADSSGVIIDKRNGISTTTDTNGFYLRIDMDAGSSATITMYGATRSVNTTATTTSSQFGTVTTTGGVVKTIGARVDPEVFTTNIVGNDVAETVIGGRITVDCIGYDYHAPSDIINHLLLNYGTNVTQDRVSQSVYNGGPHGGYYKAGFALEEQSDLMTLCRQIAWQTRARFFWERGQARLKLIKAGSGWVDRNFVQRDVIINTTRIARTPFAELTNAVNVRFLNTWSKTTTNNKHFKSSATADNNDSIADNGIRANDQWFDLDFVSDDDTAGLVADFYSEYLGEVARIITFELPIGRAVDLERGDVVGLTYQLDGGCIMRKCEILEQHIVIGSGKNRSPDIVRLTCHNVDDGSNVECENNRIEYLETTIRTTNYDNATDYVHTESVVSIPLGETVSVPICTKVAVITA